MLSSRFLIRKLGNDENKNLKCVCLPTYRSAADSSLWDCFLNNDRLGGLRKILNGGIRPELRVDY